MVKRLGSALVQLQFASIGSPRPNAGEGLRVSGNDRSAESTRGTQLWIKALF